MAESIILHFSTASANEVLTQCAAFTEKATGHEMYFYPSNADYLLLLTPYRDYAQEYGPEEKAQLQEALGGEPRGSVDFELRRSRSDTACDAATEIIARLSNEFTFVIDDLSRIWTAGEALRSPDFLREYRY